MLTIHKYFSPLHPHIPFRRTGVPLSRKPFRQSRHEGIRPERRARYRRAGCAGRKAFPTGRDRPDTLSRKPTERFPSGRGSGIPGYVPNGRPVFLLRLRRRRLSFSVAFLSPDRAAMERRKTAPRRILPPGAGHKKRREPKFPPLNRRVQPTISRSRRPDARG